MSYKIFSLANAKDWTTLLNKLPQNQQDIYFTPEYYQLYEAYGDGKAQCFVFEQDGELILYPYLKNSVNSLGYQLDKEYYDIQGAYGYNGIISSSKEKHFLHAFHTCFEKYCKENNIIAEFTRFHPLLQNMEMASDKTKIIYDRKTVFFDLSKELSEIFSIFQHSTKKQIRRAENRYHIQIKTHTNPNEHVNILYDIYTQTMNKVNAVPYLYFNKEYFSNLLQLENVVLFIAYYEDKPIACISALYVKDYFHGHLGGSLSEFLKMYPNDLLYKEMILYAKKIKCKYLHVGGGDTSDINNSLLNFKMNFSKDIADFYIGKTIYNEVVYNDIIEQWKIKYPLSYQKNRIKLLGYREI